MIVKLLEERKHDHCAFSRSVNMEYSSPCTYYFAYFYVYTLCKTKSVTKYKICATNFIFDRNLVTLLYNRKSVTCIKLSIFQFTYDSNEFSFLYYPTTYPTRHTRKLL